MPLIYVTSNLDALQCVTLPTPFAHSQCSHPARNWCYTLPVICLCSAMSVASISVTSNPNALCPLTVVEHYRKTVFINTDWRLIAGWQVESFALSRDHNARHPFEMERLRSSGVQPGDMSYCAQLCSCWSVAERMLVRILCGCSYIDPLSHLYVSLHVLLIADCVGSLPSTLSCPLASVSR